MDNFNNKSLEEQIIKSLSLDNLPKEDQEKILTELLDIIAERIAAAVLSQLPESEYHTIDAMLESGDIDKLIKRLKVQVPNAEQIAGDTVEFSLKEFKELLSKNENS